jgi:tetratricopeptide (TPR) repeat protein
MANDSKKSGGNKETDAKATADAESVIRAAQGEAREKADPNWEKVLFTPERVQKWIKGELSMRDLHAITGPEMLEMAIVGFSQYEQGRYDEAQTIFTGLMELDPNESYYRTALGAVFLAKEDLEAAERCFNHAIKLNPKEIASFVNRGEVYLRQGKVMEAAIDFKAAVDLDPTGKDPLSHRARVLAAAALEAIEGAQAGKNDDAKGKPAAAKPAAPPAKEPAKPAALPPAKKR